MTELLNVLSHALGGAPLAALGASFAWGVLSVVLSPCHLGSLPLIVGFINGQGRMTSRRALGLSTLFAGGILLTIALIGAATAAAGRMLGDVGPYGNFIAAAIFFAVGLHLLDVISLSWTAPHHLARRHQGLFGAFLLGLLFGIALGPCTFAYMAPVLGMVLKLGAVNLPYGVLLLVTYGLGHCSVIVLAGTSAEWVQRFLDWNETSHGTRVVKRVCGTLLLIAGVWLVYTAPR
jgi:cytochrome c-type biogenesis protein